MAALTLSPRALAIGESATLAITAHAAAMRQRGLPVISLAAGEPDFATPEHVREAGIAAIREGRTRYTAASGLPEARRAACGWFERVYGVAAHEAQVMVTGGAKPALHMALQALVAPGDRVLLPAPYWVSYPDLVRVAGGEPIDIEATPENGFLLDPELLDGELRRTGARGVILNYPNNPSGAVLPPERMEAVLRVAVAHGAFVISDEIYGTLLYDGALFRSAASFDFARDRVVVVNGGTKSHSMTGWRVGFLLGPEELVAAAGRIQSQVIGNACTASQYAAMAFCAGGDDDEQAQRLASFDQRRRRVVAALRAMPAVSLREPKAAFYALIDARALCARTGLDDAGLAERMLDEVHVALVPGSAFAIPGFLRLSYAASMDEIDEAMARMHRFVEA